MYFLLVGAIATGCATISLFFLKFWRRTGERFFLYFSVSFFIEGCSRVVLAAASLDGALPYLARLVAYLFIILAIWEKNRRSGQ